MKYFFEGESMKVPKNVDQITFKPWTSNCYKSKIKSLVRKELSSCSYLLLADKVIERRNDKLTKTFHIRTFSQRRKTSQILSTRTKKEEEIADNKQIPNYIPGVFKNLSKHESTLKLRLRKQRSYSNILLSPPLL